MPDLEPITRDEKLWSGEDLEPITRREMYIKHLYDETQVIPDKPITREEMFILKAGEELHDVTIEQLNVTENGTYSEAGKAYSPVIVNVPQTTLTTLDVTENGTYTAPSGTAYNEVEVDVPLPENAYLLKDIPATPASIATFPDGSALPMPKLEIAVEPQQDLHGYDAPWVGGAGKNKLQNVRSTTTINGITFTVNNDGSVFIAGGQTASEFTAFNLIANDLNYYNLTDFGLSYNTDYIINGCPSGGSSTTYRLAFRSGGSAGNKVDAGSGVSFNIASDGDTLKWMPCIMINANYTIPSGGLLFKPMIRLASVTDATFAPYSNICPISGHTEGNVSVCGKNLFDKTTNVLNGYTTSDGTFRASNSGEKTFYCKVPKGTITMGKPVGTSVLRGVLFDSIPSNNDVGYEVLQYESNAKQTFTTTKETYYVCYCYNNTGETNTWQSVLDSIQVEIGSSATTYEPYNGHTYTIPFQDAQGNPITVYGGTLDVVSGVLTLTYLGVDMGTLTWAKQGDGFFFSNNVEGLKIAGDAISSLFKIEHYYPTMLSTNGTLWINDTRSQIMAHLDGYTVTADFKTAMNGVQLVYELATPTIIPLGSVAISSLLGVNNIFADCGNIIDGQYFGKGE